MPSCRYAAGELEIAWNVKQLIKELADKPKLLGFDIGEIQVDNVFEHSSQRLSLNTFDIGGQGRLLC